MWGCFLMSGVKILHFLKRLMEIHSNSPNLYYGFNLSMKKRFIIPKVLYSVCPLFRRFVNPKNEEGSIILKGR